MRSRLLLLIIIPTLTSVVLGGTYIATSAQQALSFQRVETLAKLSSDITVLAAHLEDERDETMKYIGLGQVHKGGRGDILTPQQLLTATPAATQSSNLAKAELQLVQQLQGRTDPWIRKVRADSANIGAGYPPQVQEQAQQLGTVLSKIPQLRTAATTSRIGAVDVMTAYISDINSLLTIDNGVALGSGDAALNNDVRSLNLVSLIAEETSEQRGLLVFEFAVDKNFDQKGLSAMQTAVAEQAANLAEFNRVATADQVALFNRQLHNPAVGTASTQEQQAINKGISNQALNEDPTTANDWFGQMTIGSVQGARNVEQNLVAATIARSNALRQNAIITASVVGGAVLIVLLLALLLTTIVGRSMVRPLRRLRSGALEVAGVRLPETVRRMSEADGAAVPLHIEPINVDSSDEIGEVARAFDQVHREALRLAANEAALRGNVNAMFVNLSRRSQSLVERQIKLIDDLEQGEQDADRLSNLFQMDHLATRMRRNSENLLVLAGHEATRRWNQPVALVDVLRAAVSEIEQYERVRLNVQPGIAVRGHAVNDVVHLLAELAENATSFSSADTPVVVAGHLLSSGGVLLDITDQGVGMGAEEMAHANWRLDNPPVVDVAVSRRMGLFVVARLAARHGIRVRLRPAPAGGLTALVWLPDEVVSREAGVSAPPRFELPAMSAPVTPAPAGPARGRNGAGPSRAPVAEPETNPGRVPRFGPLRAGPWRREPDDDSGTRPQRVPGPGDRSAYAGQGSGMTNPLPKVGSEPAEAEVAAEPGEWSGDRDRPRVVGGGRGRGRGADAPAADGGVVVPPADPTAGNRLPIFEAVESDWFRRGRSGAPASSLSGSPRGRARRSATVAAAPSAPESEVAWRASGADEGWEAAAAAKAPSTGGTTNAGLPRRVPRANLVPGAAPPESVSPVPTRSAATTRDRFASFQRGIREGRAAASRDEGDSDGDDGS